MKGVIGVYVSHQPGTYPEPKIELRATYATWDEAWAVDNDLNEGYERFGLPARELCAFADYIAAPK